MEIGLVATDDAAILEYFGHPVKIIMGDYSNIKITTPEDLDLAAGFWRGEGRMRVGIGYDVHPLVKDRPLVLEELPLITIWGWPAIPIDVLLHALADALGSGGSGGYRAAFSSR